jgi:NDP-sugar pyrophosphorylase family protein
MVEYKVLITTSGLGSRLGDLTDYTNKSLVRIGNKPTISYIIESYPTNSEFVITLGHYGEQVKDFLELAYPNLNFTFVEVDKYKGDGSSLLYSLSKCEKHIDKPFIYHACDTVIDDYNIPNLENNWVIGANKKNSYHYRTLNIDNNQLIKINEKGEIGFDLSYIGICGIKDYKLFFSYLIKTLSSDIDDLSDTHVINLMLEQVNFNVYQFNKWFDIGNTSELTETREYFKGDIHILDKKDESIFFFDDFVIKFFYNKEVNKNRIIRANKLGDLTPNIIDYRDNFYKYEMVKGNLFSESVNRNKFINFLEWSKNNLWIKKEDSKIKDKCIKFYIEKTYKRVEQYLKSDTDKKEVINGEVIPSVFKLIEMIDIDWFCDGIPTQYHGDFILDNVIETEDGFKLIDWRQDFAGDLELGDIYYDLAKLNHNLSVNHDIVNKNLYCNNSDNCYILLNSKLNECKGVLYSFIKENGYDLKKVQILTTIIWLNMSPLHEHPFSSFLFKFGKYNLYKNLIKIK